MGLCFGSPAKTSDPHHRHNNDDDAGPPSVRVCKTPSIPFTVTVAFPNVDPLDLTVAPNDTIASIRGACEREMQRRQTAGLDFVRVEGKLMTLNPDNGDAETLKDTMTVREAFLEPKQYLWFHDHSESIRIDDLILRSSRIHQNRSHNSRGVKAGMALIKEEEAAATATTTS